MTAAIPISLPPVELQDRAVKALLTRLSIDEPDFSVLKFVLAITARQALSGQPTTDPRPLQAMLNAPAIPQDLCVELLINAIVSYPTNLLPIGALVDTVVAQHPGTVESIRTEIIPDLVTRLRLSDSGATLAATAKILLGLQRSHEELFGVVLSEADYILPALKDAYPKLGRDRTGLKAKSDILLVCHSVIRAMTDDKGGASAMKRLMDDQAGPSKRVLVEGGLRGDYEAVFERMSGLRGEEISELHRIRDDEARNDPRLETLLTFFPSLPPYLLVQALNHPSYAPTTEGTAEEAAAPVLDAILTGGQTLPDDLAELRDRVAEMTSQQMPPSNVSNGVNGDKATRAKRSNIWDEEKLDVSKLRIKDDDDVPTLQMGNSIPDHLRASIMRLVQSQQEEAEEVERALREAHGAPPDDDDDTNVPQRAVRVAEGEESGDESGDKVVARRGSDKVYNVDQQSQLELAYLSDARVFERDSITRRSEARRKLKELTKMDDAQLEGWKIMLERNPHKEAILSRHTFTPKDNFLGDVSKPAGDAGSKGKGKGEGGKGGGQGGQGGGGGQGGEGSRGGRGGGGGRGRGSKGNRGHSNAARTRGHDKKMAKMGAGT